MKVAVFFNRIGGMLHGIRKDKTPAGRWQTFCQKLLPTFYNGPKGNQFAKLEGLVLECPECQAVLAGLCQQEQEIERAIYEPTPAGASSRHDHNGTAQPPHSQAARGGSGEAGACVPGGGAPPGPSVPGQPVDDGRDHPVAAEGGPEKPGKGRARTAPPKGKSRKSQG